MHNLYVYIIKHKLRRGLFYNIIVRTLFSGGEREKLLIEGTRACFCDALVSCGGVVL